MITDLIVIKIIRQYYEQLHTNKLCNLDEIETFLDSNHKLTQEEMKTSTGL